MRPLSLLLACLALLAPRPAFAQAPSDTIDTRIVVHVLAQDAKLIGEAAGGARVVVQDVHTGRVLADGLHTGGTGDTDRIVRTPHTRGETRFGTEGAARFEAMISLTRPTLVEIAAYGPLDPSHAGLRASLQTWLLPGADVDGDGFVLTLNGFIVGIDPEATHVRGDSLRVQATAMMLCTCPLEPGGLWDADRVAVHAVLRQGDAVVATGELSYAGEQNTFAGTLPLPDADAPLTLEVTASDPARANFGRAARLIRP